MTPPEPRPLTTALKAALEAYEREWLDATPPAGHPLIHGIFQRLPDRLALRATPAAEAGPTVSGLREALDELLALTGRSHPHDEGRECGTCKAYSILARLREPRP